MYSFNDLSSKIFLIILFLNFFKYVMTEFLFIYALINLCKVDYFKIIFNIDISFEYYLSY